MTQDQFDQARKIVDEIATHEELVLRVASLIGRGTQRRRA